ncbi:MAG: TIGR04282 family arsenosugar biosynthesis glycosyltransferase [Magnetococcales bacterium]|nr:TIGR04282 family arsenosugar biosynthesis glycosyltransferase [Magnetococcales bacterium]
MAAARGSLHLFGRAPLAGRVKTRLIPLLGPEGAAAAQGVMVKRACALAQGWCRSRGVDFYLWCDPSHTEPFFATLLPEAQRRSQPPLDLGARMLAAVREGLERGAWAMLLGTDAVSVDQGLLDRAASALRENEAVLAPAEDGGYVLLGLRRVVPELFEQMPWGTDRVAALTRQQLEGQGLPWLELPRQWDVDTPEDWLRFCRTWPEAVAGMGNHDSRR